MHKCVQCNELLTLKTAYLQAYNQGGKCRKCAREYARSRYNGTWKQQIFPRPTLRDAGKKWTFPCGCSGILPNKKGESNKFAVWIQCKNWYCRVSIILSNSRAFAKTNGTKPCDISDTPTGHRQLRVLMEETICSNPKCSKPLIWKVGKNKPHLDHNHATGKIRGFMHGGCNNKQAKTDRENLIETLQTENKKLLLKIKNMELMYAAKTKTTT